MVAARRGKRAKDGLGFRVVSGLNSNKQNNFSTVRAGIVATLIIMMTIVERVPLHSIYTELLLVKHEHQGLGHYRWFGLARSFIAYQSEEYARLDGIRVRAGNGTRGCMITVLLIRVRKGQK